ncbi:hypothetical protein F383_34551 [Gossypium arboreum]|uniref:Uncharacterized protein n=1 Tax=Gossypium arboreum TaxID=29729 RepID=A0A0B0N451_GOSAR|nr:hypothetical protein F383_34551 [Gossypium arboreum]
MYGRGAYRVRGDRGCCGASRSC